LTGQKLSGGDAFQKKKETVEGKTTQLTVRRTQGVSNLKRKKKSTTKKRPARG